MAGISKSTPSRLAKFPPALPKKRHKVKTGDNWWTLAVEYGRVDPWDIIEYNFRTRDPREVNFYLEFYVGCTKPSSDGHNYRFDSSDTPGHIYIPRSSWTRSEDLALRHMVGSALSGGVISRLSMQYAGQTITGGSLAAVANRVIDGDIRVVVDSSLNSDEAEYDSGTDTLHLGFDRARARTKKGLIVHEAVHAALDMRAVSGMSIAESESMAYVVQCYYVREHMRDPDSGDRLTDSNARKDKVYEIAWGMAEKLGEGKQPTSLEWSALDSAVRRHPKYRRIAADPASFDGV